MIVSQLFFDFHDLTVSRCIGQVFCRISLDLFFNGVFLMVRLRLWVFVLNITEVKCPSYHISGVHAIMFLRFLDYRVTFSSPFHMPFFGSKSTNAAHTW